MGFLNSKKKEQNLDLDGYIIDTERGLLINVPTNLSVYNIPSIVKEISMSVLNNMKQSAEEINFSLNTNMNSLPFGAFSGFKKLAKVVLPPNLKKMDYFFDGNALSNGVEIVLPKDLEQFALNQFSPSTVRLELEDSVMAIKGGIVSHNNVLEELIISGNIKSLAKYSINQVKFLKKIWIKDGINYMEDEAIRGCNNLREVHIPESLKIFKLGNDDFRPVKGFSFNGKNYIPTQEEQEKEQNRTIKLYKMINGNEVVFEVKRNEFKSMTDTGKEFVFKGYDNSQYRIQKEKVVNHEYISVDIITQQMFVHDKNRTINDRQPSSATFNDDRKAQSSQPSNASINISGKRTETSKKSTIEKLLNLPISSTKRIKDQATGNLKTVLKTQQELSDDMASLLEELEEDYVVEQLDSKTINEYKRYLQTIYREFISNAPFESMNVDDTKTSSKKKDFYQEAETTSNRSSFIRNSNLIKQLLGTAFENYSYVTGSNGTKQMVSKTQPQLQIEYSSLIRKLDEKLNTGEFSDTQYDLAYASLTSLYHAYINGLIPQTKVVSENQRSPYQEPQQYSQPEPVDKIDEYVEKLRHKYGYYEMDTSEQERMDQFIYSEIQNDKKETDKVDGIRGWHRK